MHNGPSFSLALSDCDSAVFHQSKFVGPFVSFPCCRVGVWELIHTDIFMFTESPAKAAGRGAYSSADGQNREIQNANCSCRVGVCANYQMTF